jgi:hypothetical protein
MRGEFARVSGIILLWYKASNESLIQWGIENLRNRSQIERESSELTAVPPPIAMYSMLTAYFFMSFYLHTTPRT